MPKPTAWWTVPSWSLTPKKTFFGLDKHNAHTFTIPEPVVTSLLDPLLSEFFWPNQHGQNTSIQIIVVDSNNDKVTICDAEMRYGDQKTGRQFYAMQWSKFPETKRAIKECFSGEYDLVKNGKSVGKVRCTFTHVGGRRFALFRTDTDFEETNTTPTRVKK